MSQPAAAIRIGTILRETYELTSELGKGGMGAVFLAQHLRLPGKQVAVKILYCEDGMSPELHARFHREAEITSRLNHPNIVQVHDFHSMEDGTPYLVMEYLRGESLSRRIRQGPLPIQEALSIARQIGSALHTAHQAGVIHRDLKPGNVFLVPTESGGVVGQQVKLLDFGISKLATAQTLHTQEDVLIGTPRYMAPEQAMGKNREVDARSDQFSLGSIIYEMLAGQPPFSADSVAGLVYSIVYDPHEPLGQLRPDVPEQVAAAVDRALAKKPSERFPDVASFIAELTGTPLQSLPQTQPQPEMRPRVEVRPRVEAAIATVAARPVTPPVAKVEEVPVPAEPSRPEPPPRSKVPMVAGVATVLLLGTAAIGWWSMSSRPPSPTPSPSVAEAPARTAPNAETPPKVEPPPEARPEGPAQSAQASNTSLAEPRPAARPSARQDTPEEIPEAVRKDLEEAEQALAANNAAEALRIARRSQRTKITGMSFSLLTRAHCRQSDLTNARAQWTKVPPAERNRVRQYCKQYEINL